MDTTHQDVRDAIGERGEWIFYTHLTRFDHGAPRFRLTQLGAKWRTADFLVELEQTPAKRRCVFLAQVKTSSGEYRANGRLKLQAPRADMVALAAYPMPCYLVGVDHTRERSFIVAAQGRLTGLSSISVEHRLDDEVTRRALWQEVKDYWSAASRPKWSSRLVEKNWSVR